MEGENVLEEKKVVNWSETVIAGILHKRKKNRAEAGSPHKNKEKAREKVEPYLIKKSFEVGVGFVVVFTLDIFKEQTFSMKRRKTKARTNDKIRTQTNDKRKKRERRETQCRTFVSFALQDLSLCRDWIYHEISGWQRLTNPRSVPEDRTIERWWGRVAKNNTKEDEG
jgi:hypothetical protein